VSGADKLGKAAHSAASAPVTLNAHNLCHSVSQVDCFHAMYNETVLQSLMYFMFSGSVLY